MTLVEFLTARLDADEAAAKRMLEPISGEDSGGALDLLAWPAARFYLAQFNPARVLREVEAKRAILSRYEFARNQVAVGGLNEAAGYGQADAGWPLREDSHGLDIRSLAAVYSDHPDYRQDWA